jgi:HNH endonuclease
LEEVLGHAQEHFRSLLPREGRYADARAQWLRATVLMDLGLPPGRGTLWDADHVVPLVLGGGDTLENLRTLCIPCHAAVTAPTQTMAAKAARLQRKMPRRPPVAYSRG